MKVAIIGAGIAGSYMAHSLKQLNHEVKVLEKTEYPGGFCFNYVDNNNISYPMSAMFLLKKYVDKKNIIKKLAEQYHIPLLENRNAFYKDNEYKLTFSKMLFILGGFFSYSAMYFFYHYIKKFGYLNLQAMKKKGMEEFLKILCYEKMSLIGVMDEDYDIRNNFYILSPVVLIEILLNLVNYSRLVIFLGDGSFIQIINELLKDIDIQYEINIESILRTDKNIQIRYSKNHQIIEETFDKVVIATYPHNILPIMSPLNEHEKTLLANDTVNMIEGGCTVLCDIEWNKEPHMFIEQSYLEGVTFNYYARVKQYSLLGILFDDGIYNEDLIAKIIKNNNGTLKKVIYIKNFSGYRLFYRNYDVTKQLNETLQGAQNTYYVGSIPAASGLTNTILNYCETILDKMTQP